MPINVYQGEQLALGSNGISPLIITHLLIEEQPVGTPLSFTRVNDDCPVKFRICYGFGWFLLISIF